MPRNVHAARIDLQGRMASPLAAAQALVNDSVVTLPVAGKNKLVTAAAPATGVIMTAGVEDGQEVTLVNSSANSITFAAAATSLVADGASAIIAANTRMTLVWDQAGSRWYHGN